MAYIFKYLTFVLYVFLTLEMLFFPTWENTVAIFTILIGWKLLIKYIFTERNFKLYPLSCFSFLGMGLFYFYFSPIITLMEWKPITFNLEMPVTTFLCQLLYLILLLFAFRLSKKLYRKYRLDSTLKRLNFFYIPNTRQLWVLGFIGLASMIFFSSRTNIETSEKSGMDRILESFRFLASAPLILFSIPKSFQHRIKSSPLWILLLYLILLIICAILTNRRHYIFEFIGIPLLLKLLNLKHSIKTKYIYISSLSFVLLLGPVSDFCLAMFSLRTQIYELSGKEMLQRTWENFNDKRQLETTYALFGAEQEYYSSFNYSEYYVENILFNRFCNMKAIDNSIVYVNKINPFPFGDSFMQEKISEKILFLLPAPIVKIISPNSNKYMEMSYGFHDYLINRANNVRGGGYRVGGDTGIGFATFGLLFIPFVVIFYGVYFFIMNSFVLNTNNQSTLSIFSICMLFTFVYIFQSNHGFWDDINYLFRIIPQNLFFYVLLINLAKKIF